MDTSPPESHQSSDYPESSNASVDGFISWERARKSSAYRAARSEDVQHDVAKQQEELDVSDGNEFDNSDNASNLYQDQQLQQQQQQQQQIRSHSQPYSKPANDQSDESDETSIHGPTPFRPMAPKEFALGNTLRRSRPAMPMATLPADATIARKDSNSTYTPSQASASLASGSQSVDRSEIEMVHKMLQQQQQIQKGGLANVPFEEEQDQLYRRQATDDSMQRISENSRDSSGSTNAISEEATGRAVGKDEPLEKTETVGKEAGQVESNLVGATNEKMNESATKLSLETTELITEAKMAEKDGRTQSFSYLSETSANEVVVYEGDPTESWRQSPAGGRVNETYYKQKAAENISDNVKERQLEQESVNSSTTGGYAEIDDEDENDEDDISYDIGTEMGLHSIRSVEQSDISETDSGDGTSKEAPSSNKALDTPGINDEVIGHNLTHEETLSTTSTDDKFPITSQAIAIADKVDTQGASGAITARFGKLLQECRDLTETCGDDSVRDSTTGSHIASTAKTSPSNLQSSTTETEANERERRLSSSQLKAAAAMAAANSTNLQRRSYSNPVTQKHEVDTSDNKHLLMSQLTVDPALHSSIMSTDYRDLKSSTFTGLMHNMELQESQSSNEESTEESIQLDGYTESFKVPLDTPLGRRAPRSDPSPVARSMKSLVSELSLGVDAMYGEADEDAVFDKSGSLDEDMTAPFDPSRVLAQLNPSSSLESSENSAGNVAVDNENIQGKALPTTDEMAKPPTVDTNEAPSAAENTPSNSPHAFGIPAKEIKSSVRPLTPTYKSGASYISSEFSVDEGGLLVGFGQRNVMRSIATKSSVSSSSSSTSSGAFSSGSDESSSDESSSSGSSDSSSSSSGDESASSSNSLVNLARNGLQIQSSRDSVSELSFGGASALMAFQSSRTLQHFPNRPNLAKEEEPKTADQAHINSTPSTPSKSTSSDSGQQTNDSSSRTDRRASLIGDVDQLEKLDEVSESTASDFLADVSSVGDNNNAVQNFLEPTNEYEITSNTSSLWSSATSTGLKNIPTDKLLSDSLSSSASSVVIKANEERMSTSSPKSAASSPLKSDSTPKSIRSQGTPISGQKLETKQDERSSSTLSSMSRNFATQQTSTNVAAEAPAISNISETLFESKSDSVTSENKSSRSLESSGSRPNKCTEGKSINSNKSLDSASAASSGSYYKGVLARAAAMNQIDDNDALELQDDSNVEQPRSKSQIQSNLSEDTLSEGNILNEQQDGDENKYGVEQHKSQPSMFSEDLPKTPQLNTNTSQVEAENPTQYDDIKLLVESEEHNDEVNEESNTAANDDLSSMSSVVSKARTSMRASFISSGELIESKQVEELKNEPTHQQSEKQSPKQSMKSSYSYYGEELYEDFPSKDENDEVIQRNRSSASQVVSEEIETDARRPWKTTARDDIAVIPDESVISVQSSSQRGSVVSAIDEMQQKETRENINDDDTSDGSLTELFQSKEALKRMGAYSSVLDLGPNISSGDDDSSVSHHNGTPEINSESIRQPLEDETNMSESDLDKKVESLRDSIRSSIQSIKEQFFGETRSNYSKSVTSAHSIGSIKEASNEEEQHPPLSVTSIDNSDETSPPCVPNNTVESKKKSTSKMLADTARHMSALLDHSLSSRSLHATKPNESTSAGESSAKNESNISSAVEERVQTIVDYPETLKVGKSNSSQSEQHDDQSIFIEDLDDVESMVKVFKKKESIPVVEHSSEAVRHVSFNDDGDEEIGLPPNPNGDDPDNNKNEAISTEGPQNSSDTSWWKEKLTKPRLIWGSVIMFVLIIVFSSIGATLSNRNRKGNPTNQPTLPPSRLTTDWVQVGDDLKGEMPGDEAGFSISASDDGFTVVVGARRNGNTIDDTENRGAAQIFRFTELSGLYEPIWIYRGESKGDQCGFSVDVSKDGRRIAVGCPGSDTYGKNSGKVRIYTEDEMSNTWIMVSEFYGEGRGDLFGASVSLSPEGTHLAVGAPYYTRDEVRRSGSAYAFREVTESVWQPFGNPMRGGVEESLFGWSVSLSSGGTFLAVGAPETSESMLNGGFVKVFSYEGEGTDWQDYGDTISKGIPSDRFGFSVRIAGDETLQRVAIGAPGNSANGMKGNGLACVYEHNGNGWSNSGDDLLGENEGENLGYAVSLTQAANQLIVGVPRKQIDGETVGQVQVFSVGAASLTPAGEIYGLKGEMFGVSVAISNNGKRFLGGSTISNLVRVYTNISVINFNN